MTKIYLSGPITNIPLQQARNNFFFAKLDFYEEMGQDGIYNKTIINPFDIKPFLGLKNWWCYMIADLWALRKCDSIYMLDGWQQSRGACIEHLYAVWTKKTIIYQ